MLRGEREKMKRKILVILSVLLMVVSLAICAYVNPIIVSTYEKTASEQIENVGENNQFITMVTYYKMRNGIWKTDEYTYKYRLILSGNMLGGREQSISYIYLSNRRDISFEQAWLAAMSSNMDDRLEKKDAVWVAYKFK